ncbi:hypothetical protein ACFFS2_16030 [Streptomyces aurantiacus]|uniref:Uncharacterized protein n=1 Tax=Streptomyces aurantiacus TaxID=47760 RepID=A0A7G1NS23_9ACTN|nr:hypothetical protein [Streptomyces aurantiacus]BCL26063.1 hypothetical protein GCM10017557_09220 [Streptomyces aurantiacus]
MAGLRFPPLLTSATWESVLQPRRAPLAADGRWTARTLEQGLHLDFARVEFVDLAALARALLLVDAAVRDGVLVQVTLPTAELPDAGGERPAAEPGEETRRRLIRQARSRGDTRAFMRQVGFLGSLRATHWPEGSVEVLDAAVEQVEETAGGEPAARDEAPYVRRRILPFEWLAPLEGPDLRASSEFRTIVARLRDLGLSPPDADALSQTVLVELLENVAEHGAAQPAGAPPRPLVGAVLMDPLTYGRRHQDMSLGSPELAELATRTRSQVLRLLVGDSGSGLVTRLDPVQARLGVPSGVEPPDGRRPTEAEDTVFYAFEHGPHRPRGTAREAPRPGQNGLWRVKHLVRSYGGSVVVRTADTLTGWVYSEADGRAVVTDDSLSRAPGTLHEVQVLTDPKAQRTAVSWVERPEVTPSPRLRWVRCVVDPVGGLDEADRTRLTEAARETARDPRLGGVVLSMTLRDTNYLTRSGLQDALRTALQVASDLADLTALAVLFPDADPKVLDLSVSGLHAEQGGGAVPLPGPVLVHGCYGPPIWYGGSPAVRAVLGELSRAGGVLPEEAAMRCWEEAGGEAGDGLWRALERYSRLFDVSGGKVSLALTPPSVLRTLDEKTRQELARVIENSSPRAGVSSGLFRTPGLRLTRRWVDSALLLGATTGVSTAAYVLARKVETALTGRVTGGAAPTMVAHVSAAPLPLAARLSECLALGGRHHAMPGELDLEGLHRSERVQAGERVVLVTDLLSTENTARRAAAAIVGAGAEPAAIACVVDARQEHRDIQLLNRSIPVVSLTEVDIGSPLPAADVASAGVVDIDPILRHPVVPTPQEPPRVPEIDFLRLCAGAPDTLSLGHLAGPRSHSSALLYLDRALRHPETGGRITDIVLDVLREALETVQDASAPGEGHPLQLWFAGQPDDAYDSRLPQAVHQRLGELGRTVHPLVTVPRGVARNQWIYPTAVPHTARGRTVIVLEGRASTGTTLRQMVRLAAAGGAAAVIAVVLLNHLEPQDAATLRMLRTVTPPGGGTAVPVVVRFVSGSSIPGESPHDCAICQTRDRVRDDTAAPDRLRRHADQLRALLRPRRREEVFSSAAADLFTVPVGADDITDYIRWRGLLRESLRDTASRQRVVDILRTLVDDDRSREGEFTQINLLRLLAAEQQWLKLPPLRFTEARELLTPICVAGLGRSANISPWLRVQALMVLAATTPQQLIEELPRLLPLVLDEPILVDHMLMECYRLLRRPPHDSPIDIGRLRESLLRCRAVLGEQGPSPSRPFDEYQHVVQQLITMADHKARPEPDDPQKAWEQLREDLGHAVKRHRLDSGLLRVRDYLEDLEDTEPTVQASRDARSDWEICKRHLADRALVCLPVLRHILAGDYVGDLLGRSHHDWLTRLSQDGISALTEVSDRLDRLLREPRRVHDLEWMDARDELLEQLDRWYRMFLATHVPETGKPAHIVDLVSSAPIELEPRIDGLLTAHGTDVEKEWSLSGTPRTHVFCPEPLLTEAIEHVLDNTRRHRVPGADSRLRVTGAGAGPDAVRVAIRNTGTRPHPSPGQGLRALDAKLRPFGATLSGRALSEGGFSFEAALTLRLWEGA